MVEKIEKEVEAQESEVSFPLVIKLDNGVALELSVLPTTSVQELRQFVYDNQKAQFFTCFYLAFNGKKVKEMHTLAEIDGFVCGESGLDGIQGEYTDHEIRVHINRLREILTYFRSPMTSVYGIDQGLSFFGAVLDTASGEGKERDGKAIALFSDVSQSAKNKNSNINLSAYRPANYRKPQVSCLESITLSAWNPVPLERKMVGDIMYLAIQTLELESSVLEVTCSAAGFHVSLSTSTVFNPKMKGELFPTLVALLQSKSAIFKVRFAEVREDLQGRNPFEYLATPSPAKPWAVTPEVHGPDNGRSLDSQFITTDIIDTLSGRDWNDDFATARDMPRESATDRIGRDQSLVRAHGDYVEAAIKAVMAVVNKSVSSVNPLDDESSQMYIHNNIFLSEGYDAKESFEDYGGLEASHVALGKDISGIRAISMLDLPDVHTMGTLLMDYKGRRIVAQTIAPGILKRSEEQEQSIQYGSGDGGNLITSNPDFSELVGKIGQLLHIAEHPVLDGKGDAHQLGTSFDTKWIKGTDGRKYVLDLFRTTPVDISFLESIEKDAPYPHKMTLLRHELIQHFYEHNVRIAIKAHQEKVEAEKKVAVEAGLTPKTEEETNAEFSYSMLLNPDAFTHVKAPENHDVKADESAVREASGFISVMISKLLLDFVRFSSNIPVDSEGLVRAFHSRGINMRYLGKVTFLFEKVSEFPVECLKGLMREEMVVRSAKRILRGLLADLPLRKTGGCIAHFLNCLFAEKTVSLKSLESYSSLDSATLHKQITEMVSTRFRYKLSSTFWKDRRYTTLRSLCLKVGIQLQAKSYDFQSFKASDILNLYPILKHALPYASLAAEAMDHGRQLLSEDDEAKKASGLEVSREALSIYEQVYGPVHQETGRAYAKLAIIAFANNEIKQAVAMQRRAVLIAERCGGVDSADAIQQFLNLAYFEFSDGDAALGLVLMDHARKGWEVLAQGEHPDSSAIYANIASMLQKLDSHDLAISYFEKSRSINEKMLGETEQLASSYDCLTKAYFLNGDFRKALTAQQRVYKFYKSAAGDKDERTVTSSSLLKMLTSKAVEIAKAERNTKKVGAAQVV